VRGVTWAADAKSGSRLASRARVLYLRAMPATIDPDGVEIVTIRELVDLRDLRIVEIGSRDGRLTFECGPEAASVLAFDSDDGRIAKARAQTPAALRRRIRFEVADAAQIELPKGEFDLALFSWSL
jgi:ubiquinone/menaquinone biosynthesis C-methylase UbiE